MCLHSNTVDDDRQGETICTDCGVVIGPIYYHQHYFGKEEEEKSESSSSSSSPPPPPPPPSPSKRRSTSPIYLTEVNKHIRHICANAHICDAVCDYAISIVSSTVRNNNNNNHISNRKMEGIAAYAIYAACVKMNCPRQMDEIGNFCNVSVKQMWDVQKVMGQVTSTPEIKAVDYVTRYCSLLEIEYANIKVITQLASCRKLRQKVGCIKSNCLIAVIIYLYCREKKIAIPLKKILEVCGGISSTSVFRAIRKLHKEHTAKITMLL